jgi:hypothetical protein
MTSLRPVHDGRVCKYDSLTNPNRDRFSANVRAEHVLRLYGMVSGQSGGTALSPRVNPLEYDIEIRTYPSRS